MIYDELIEELALTLLTKARYEGCISVIDGFSQCEEDKTRIEYPVDAVMRIMPAGSEIWSEECEPLLKKIGAETIGDVADYLNKNKSENSSADDVLFTALLKICYENMDMDGKMVFWENMLENNFLEWRDVELNAKKSLWLQRQFGNMCCSPTKCCTLQTSGIILYRLSSRSRKKEPALGL